MSQQGRNLCLWLLAAIASTELSHLCCCSKPSFDYIGFLRNWDFLRGVHNMLNIPTQAFPAPNSQQRIGPSSQSGRNKVWLSTTTDEKQSSSLESTLKHWTLYQNLTMYSCFVVTENTLHNKSEAHVWLAKSFRDILHFCQHKVCPTRQKVSMWNKSDITNSYVSDSMEVHWL